jgi:hypothetical protein
MSAIALASIMWLKAFNKISSETFCCVSNSIANKYNNFLLMLLFGEDGLIIVGFVVGLNLQKDLYR